MKHLVVGSWLLALSCTPSVPAGERPHDVVVTERDADREVSVASGGTLVVRLGAQLGTGYGWQIAENDPSRLKPPGRPELEGSGGAPPGGAQDQVFRFAAMKPGTVRLVLRYARPWEPDAPAKSFRIDVRIR